MGGQDDIDGNGGRGPNPTHPDGRFRRRGFYFDDSVQPLIWRQPYCFDAAARGFDRPLSNLVCVCVCVSERSEDPAFSELLSSQELNITR